MMNAHTILWILLLISHGTVTTVTGFHSMKACNDAGKIWLIKMDGGILIPFYKEGELPTAPDHSYVCVKDR